MPIFRAEGGKLAPFNQSEILSQILLDGPEVYFRFDEPSGLVAIDHSGFGRHGTYNNDVQLGKPAISSTERSAYNPQLSFSYPAYIRSDGYGNITRKQDFSAVALVKISDATTKGAFFNIGSDANVISVGKGNEGNMLSAGTTLAANAAYQAYINPNVVLNNGLNLIGLSARARDNFLNFYVNGVCVFSVAQVFNPPLGVGSVGFVAANNAVCLCDFGEFSFFTTELPANRFAAYWKAVQLN
jgi:hypothetical protein